MSRPANNENWSHNYFVFFFADYKKPSQSLEAAFTFMERFLKGLNRGS